MVKVNPDSRLTRVLRDVRNQTDQDQTPERRVRPSLLDILPLDSVLDGRQTLGRVVSQDSLRDGHRISDPWRVYSAMSTTHVYGNDLFTLGEPALSDERSLGLDRADGQPAVGEDGNHTSEETLGESWWSEPPLKDFLRRQDILR